MRWPRRTFYTLAALALLQTWVYYPQMPPVMASHWDGLGAADAWSGRTAFFAGYLAIVAMVILVFEFVPRFGLRGKRMKIPHAEYWLAPERIAHTRTFFRRQMVLMGIVHLALAVFVMQLAILANFATEPRLHGSIFWALAIYLLLVIAWLLHFYLYFRRP
ncbi:MAG: DUF1648 domain-containing protein [Gammaproteobacteria bacterium]|nr:DUF1648 domain-containing protein [Gammaproteobacteria bacterium]